MHQIILTIESPVFAAGIKNLLHKKYTLTETTDKEKLIGLLQNSHFDLLITDAETNRHGCEKHIIEIAKSFPYQKIMVFTHQCEPELCLKLQKAKVASIMIKDAAAKDILNVINTVLSGFTCNHPQVQKVLNEYNNNYSTDKIPTARQLDVLKHICKGLSNKEIAEQLSIKPDTVKEHVKALFEKLEVRNRTELSNKAKAKGFCT